MRDTPRKAPRRGRWRAAGAAALALFLGGCVSAKIVKLDRKTQLENQILGTFQRLEGDLILASSVRGDRPAAKLSPLQQEAVEAMMSREFFRDDIEALKQKQVVGEANTGKLELLITAGEPEELARTKRLVAEENRNREIILRRVVQLERKLSERDLPRLWRVFYRLNAGAAKNGDKVQLEDGNWRVISGRGEGGADRAPAAGAPAAAGAPPAADTVKGDR